MPNTRVVKFSGEIIDLNGDKPPKALDTQPAIFWLSMRPFAMPRHHATAWHDSGIWDGTHLISTSREAVTCAKTCHVFHHITEGRLEELGTAAMSRIAIFSIMRFDFRVACPLRALLSKILLKLQTFPSLNSCFTILFSYFCLLLCFLSATNWPHSHFSLCYFTIKPLYIGE